MQTEEVKEKNLIQKIFFFGPNTYYDYGLVFVMLFLVLFGVIMVYSTTAYSDAITYGTPYRSVINHAKYAVIAVGLAILISKFDYHWIVRLSPLMYLLSLGLILYTMVAGKTANGSARWLYIGSTSIQPSELAKPSLILVLSLYLTAFYKTKLKRKRDEFIYVLIGLIITIIPVALVIGENLSTAVIIGLIGYLMCHVATKIKYILPLLILVGVVVLVVLYNSGGLEKILSGYRWERIQAWRHPMEGDKKYTYQILQGLYAIGSGGVFGKGLGSSIQKLGYLPESQNDMIFAIICEELGICGAFFVILLFVLLIIRLTFIAQNAPDMAGGLLVTGIMIHMSIQVLFNIAVVTNVFPNTGVTLPFISSGGSALVVIICEMGLALSVSNQIRK
ncbi:MAG: putative lipid II flippase FtsW [Lachnospiraceae bacterium]|nr:putative lipid II flippase FtsW [Lachnospiraceae bacterium]